MFRRILPLVILSISVCAQGAIKGNTVNENFLTVKHLLEQKVYFDHRETLYCGAKFDRDKRIRLPGGFRTPDHVERTKRIEWEHVVPAENFGRTFSEWTRGSEKCRGHKGAPYYGRKCANDASREFRLMQGDMYNLYPSIGAVNALRKHYRFDYLPEGTASTFGSCPMKIKGNAVEPPENARGRIARTHLYMQAAYPRFSLSKQQYKLMQAWDKQYPVTPWECLRARRIEALQGNENPYVKEACVANRLW